MFNLEIVTTPQGWVAAPVEPEHIEIAKERYLDRQHRFEATGQRNQHFKPDDMPDEDVDTERDHRWSGDLGEMLVKDYLTRRRYDHHWLAGVKETEYDPDFWIAGHKIDVKTKRSKGAPKLVDHYFATVNHDQLVIAKTRDVAGFIFCSYAYEDQWIYLVGKISYAQFDKIKIERNVGDQVHEHFTVSAKSWDVPITALTPPLRWVKAA